MHKTDWRRLRSIRNRMLKIPRRRGRQEDFMTSLREENARLRRAVQELSTLNELARSIGASFNSREIIDQIINRSVQAVKADQAVINLVDSSSKAEARTLARAIASQAFRKHFHLDQALLGWMMLNMKPMLVNDPGSDERLNGVKLDAMITSILAVPMMVKSELIGILTAYNKSDDMLFTEEDQRLLSIIASQSAQVIENARLLEEEKAYTKMQEQIRLARRIQLGLLPDRPPGIPGYDVAGISIPAQDVGGDYFDYIEIDAHRWVLCLGDVSGKGLPASLLMANLQATLRAQALSCGSVSECVARANKMLFRSTDPEKFATLIFGVLDTNAHTIHYSNAGHEPPLLLSGSDQDLESIKLSVGGMMIGFLEDVPYKEAKISMGPGDCIVGYSDGVTDAENSQEEPFGARRLESILRNSRGESAEETVQRIVAAVDAHSGDEPQLDDITIIVLKRETV